MTKEQAHEIAITAQELNPVGFKKTLAGYLPIEISSEEFKVVVHTSRSINDKGDAEDFIKCPKPTEFIITDRYFRIDTVNYTLALKVLNLIKELL